LSLLLLLAMHKLPSAPSKPRFFRLAAILAIIIAAVLPAQQEFEVRLKTKSSLKPIYVSRLHATADNDDLRYLEEMRSLLVYDLSHNGYSFAVPAFEAAEQRIHWADLRTRVDAVFWKREQIPAVLAVEGDKNRLAVTVIQIEKGSVRRFADIVFSKQGQDRHAIHRLADAIQKELFGVQGIASRRIIFSQRLKNSESAEPEWASDIWIADWDGANPARLTMANGYCMSPGFWPTAMKKQGYFFASNYRGQSKIYTSAMQGQPEEWIHLRGSQMLPAISTDGTKLAFITDAAGRPDLFMQSIDNNGHPVGKPVQIFTAPNATQASPAFSPDGRRIAFVSDKSGSPRIYVIDVSVSHENDRQQAALISKRNRENTSPAWSPNGKLLAYSARTEGVRQIWIYDFSTNEEWSLTTGTENKENPAWAPDSLHLIYNTETKDASELYLIDLHSQEPVRINLGFGQKRFASWEP
jgi:TolB protein